VASGNSSISVTLAAPDNTCRWYSSSYLVRSDSCTYRHGVQRVEARLQTAPEDSGSFRSVIKTQPKIKAKIFDMPPHTPGHLRSNIPSHTHGPSPSHASEPQIQRDQLIWQCNFCSYRYSPPHAAEGRSSPLPSQLHLKKQLNSKTCSRVLALAVVLAFLTRRDIGYRWTCQSSVTG
jgi:hypothetical protein